MLSSLRSSGLRLTMTALYALAMLMLGMAHRPFDRMAADPSPMAYQLADGVTASICQGMDGSDPADQAARPMVCDACLLAGAPGLGAVAAPILQPPQGVIVVAAVEAAIRVEPRPQLAPVSRGPPVVSILV